MYYERIRNEAFHGLDTNYFIRNPNANLDCTTVVIVAEICEK